MISKYFRSNFFIYEESNRQRKKSITDSSLISKSNFGARNIRPRKRLLSDNYLCKIHIIFKYISFNFFQ
jgi:hypothetical protein